MRNVISETEYSMKTIQQYAKFFQRLQFNKVCNSNKKSENKLDFLRQTNMFFINSSNKEIYGEFLKFTLTTLGK